VRRKPRRRPKRLKGTTSVNNDAQPAGAIIYLL
jgi:hypothetical protein